MTNESDFAVKLVAHWKLATIAETEETRKKLWQECIDMCDIKQTEILNTRTQKGTFTAESTLIKAITPKYRRVIAVEAGMMDTTIKGGYDYKNYPVAFWQVDRGSSAPRRVAHARRNGHRYQCGYKCV